MSVRYSGEVQSPKSQVQSFLRSGAVVFCVGTDEQADGGDAAVCAAAAGLLAIAESFKFQVFSFKPRPGRRVAGAGADSHVTPASVTPHASDQPCFLKSCPCSDWRWHRVGSRFLPSTTRSRRPISFPCPCAWEMLISYVAYMGQMFWPSGLAVLYPFAPEPLGFQK